MPKYDIVGSDGKRHSVVAESESAARRLVIQMDANKSGGELIVLVFTVVLAIILIADYAYQLIILGAVFLAQLIVKKIDKTKKIANIFIGLYWLAVVGLIVFVIFDTNRLIKPISPNAQIMEAKSGAKGGPDGYTSIAPFKKGEIDDAFA
jgi:hypothetical protein